ncbi:type VI secretion system Vgr family protein [Nannocystis bainbridge]|uniref:Type VI secretion system tip protein TssI/VgrG n=1 Tax=Nannocystis bainbridge TaxID=2995303 RepID=A0ABT5DXJ3_9BACT|nr:type VI secretion system tip protein TssI/VgrG [Nannocystis bainbridge]MDC0718275.1 type VI secretion system tip protein TssI/VgrG [Nannocystis bainbridge]
MTESGSTALLGNRSMFTFTVDGCGEELRVVRFGGEEAVSSLFEFRFELASTTIPLDDLVGHAAVLTIHGREGLRHVHGLVCDARYIGESSSYTLHEVTLVPEVWSLQQRAGSRIFQGQSTPEIVAKVLETAGIPRAGVRMQLHATYAPRDYCVQYRETDFAFVSRLLEADGMYYFFEHHEDSHVLVITDQADGGTPIAEDPALGFNATRERERLLRFSLGESIRPQRVSLRDRNLHTPAEEVEAEEGQGDARELYDYPGGFQTGGRGGPETAGKQARMRLEAVQATRRAGTGESDSPRLTPGCFFHVADESRPHLEGEYRLLRVRHRGEQPQVLDEGAVGEFSYTNRFECAAADLPYRAPRTTRRPTVHGVQTATVVGPGSEEIHCDEHGRVKVQFHWDRRGAYDDGSSCWVRVSQMWAGNGFGAMFLPRIGHEVIVDFIEGDPDRPIITGRIYTGVNTPPYPLPDQKTKSTIKSESSPGGGGSNELRFEDAKGSEEIFLHGQKDWNIVIEHDKGQSVGHDEARSVGHDSSVAIGHDEAIEVGNDRTITVGKMHVERIGANMSIGVGQNLTESVGASATFTVAADQTESIGANKAETVGIASMLTVGAAYAVTVGGAMTETVGLAKSETVGLARAVSVGGSSSESVGGAKSVSVAGNLTESAGQNIALQAGKHVNLTAGENFNAAAGKKAAIVAADQLTIQCGGATVVLKKNGDVTIQAKKLSIKASGEVTVKGSKIKLN